MRAYSTANPGLVLAGAYTLLAFFGSWACWGASAALLAAGGASGAFVGRVLLVAGTLVPLFATYALFPRLRAAGIAGMAGAPGDSEVEGSPRDGFWRFAFGGGANRRAVAVFTAFAVWRWVACRLGFGFPETPLDALGSFFGNLPLLLLGGGLEEVGWRGCLQPCLESGLATLSGSRKWGGDPEGRPLPRRRIAVMLAPVVCGLVWGFWHLPLAAIPGTLQSQVPFWGILVVGVSLSCSFAALRRACGTVRSCILSHAWYNAMLVSIPTFGPAAVALFAVEAVFGLLGSLFMAEGRSRGRD